jgi:hypothetical protein
MLDSQSPAASKPMMGNIVDASNCPFDDDLAIGCECANPALQIERWGQEASAQPLQDLS